MAVHINGNSGVIAEVDGTTFRAMRVTIRPPEYGSFVSYQKSILSGTMAAGLAANAEVMHFRWSDATRLCLVHRVTLDGLSGSATAFAAGFGKVDLLMSRSWSADGSGGTAGTLTGNNAKLRTSMGTTLLGAMRVSSTAALTAGTKTNDTDPIGQISLSFGTAVSVQYANQIDLFNAQDGTSFHPVVLAQNEGLTARATVPATGTWQFGMTVAWSEVTAF